MKSSFGLLFLLFSCCTASMVFVQNLSHRALDFEIKGQGTERIQPQEVKKLRCAQSARSRKVRVYHRGVLRSGDDITLGHCFHGPVLCTIHPQEYLVCMHTTPESVAGPTQAIFTAAVTNTVTSTANKVASATVQSILRCGYAAIAVSPQLWLSSFTVTVMQAPMFLPLQITVEYAMQHMELLERIYQGDRMGGLISWLVAEGVRDPVDYSGQPILSCFREVYLHYQSRSKQNLANIREHIPEFGREFYAGQRVKGYSRSGESLTMSDAIEKDHDGTLFLNRFAGLLKKSGDRPGLRVSFTRLKKFLKLVVSEFYRVFEKPRAKEMANGVYAAADLMFKSRRRDIMGVVPNPLQIAPDVKPYKDDIKLAKARLKVPVFVGGPCNQRPKIHGPRVEQLSQSARARLEAAEDTHAETEGSVTGQEGPPVSQKDLPPLSPPLSPPSPVGRTKSSFF